MMHIEIKSRGMLDHLTSSPPTNTDSSYQQWNQRDSKVIAWIVANIDKEMDNQFLDYPTARDLWKGIENLLSYGRDELQIFNLSSRSASLKQNDDSIESFYSKLQDIWKEIV